MLEPTVKSSEVLIKLNSIEANTIETIKPTENMDSLMTNENSLSAYASAESSPYYYDNVASELMLYPRTESSCGSLNTYWGLPPASSLLIDENDKIEAIKASEEKSNKSAEFKSLPAPESQNTTLKKELSEGDLASVNTKTVDTKTAEPTTTKPKSSAFSFMEKIFSKTSPKTETATATSTATLTATSTAATSTAATATTAITTAASAAATGPVDCSKSSLNSAIKAAAVSASSPNPECSPFKFLINEKSSNDAHKSNQPIHSCTSAEEVVSSAPSSNKIIENLTSLNQKEFEKHDPILSSLTSNAASLATNSNKCSTSTGKPSGSISPSKSGYSLSSTLSNNTDIKVVHNVPSSSREFCMNLNLNLASAAAATAGGPVAVVDNQSVKSPVPQEHNRFTSNASTSSIHNDLKMILEESKEPKLAAKSSEMASSSSSVLQPVDSNVAKQDKDDKLNKSTDASAKSGKQQAPKPQRQHKTKKTTSDASLNNTAASSSSVENSEANEANSKSSDLNLIKMMMMMMVQNNNNKLKHADHANQQLANNDEPTVLFEWPKKNGRYRYNKEFLVQIRDQRAAFIDQIYPDIFKAYCYCMNGKFWDPEKYFDIVQFPGEFDRIPANRYNNSYNRNSSHSATSTYNNRSTNFNNRKKNTPNSTFNTGANNTYNNNNYYKSAKTQLGQTPTSSLNMPDDSPQPLQVPKNSPKTTDECNVSKQDKENAHKSNILAKLGIENTYNEQNKLDADRLLLSLIKKESNKQNVSLMDILNKNPTTTTKPAQSKATKHQQSILDSLFEVKKAEQQTNNKHYPLILTAQELEMSQLNEDKLSKFKLPNEITTKSDLKHDSNDSYAYKQLVKNLSNHPLNSPSLLLNKQEDPLRSANKQHKKSSNSKPSWQVSNDGTNILKQLLNLNTSNTEAKTEKKKSKSSKKNTHKSSNKQSPHNSMSYGSASPSSNNSSPSDSSNNQLMNKFPAVNPHEKPFESFMAEENRKQIEQVVAIALNQVLNKSPSSLAQYSPKNPIEDLIEKMNGQRMSPNNLYEQEMRKHTEKTNQHEHFNLLLNKMGAMQQMHYNEPITKSSDILKWFTDAKTNTMPMKSHQFSATTLSEIEFMEMHRPQNALNKFF